MLAARSVGDAPGPPGLSGRSLFGGILETFRVSQGAKALGYAGQMKGFGKIALVFSLVGGLMAYFIIPVQFSRKRALSRRGCLRTERSHHY